MTHRLTLNLDDDLLRWLDMKVKEHIYYNRRHGIQIALRRLIELDNKLED